MQAAEYPGPIAVQNPSASCKVTDTVRTIARRVGSKGGIAFTLAVDNSGRVYAAMDSSESPEPMANRVFDIPASGALEAFAGNGDSGSLGDGGPATNAELNLARTSTASIEDVVAFLSGMAIDRSGNVYIADTQNSTIRMVAGPQSSEPSIIRSIAGKWGGAANVELIAPTGLAVDASGTLYIADAAANSVVQLSNNTLRTLVHVVSPGALAIDSRRGTLYIAAPRTHKVFELSVGGAKASVQPSVSRRNENAADTEDVLIHTVATIPSPAGLAVDSGGNLFVADAYSNRIFRIGASSTAITTAAGTGVAGYSGDGDDASRAQFNAPGSIAFDGEGNLFVADQGNHAIREIAAASTQQASSGVTLSPSNGINFGDQVVGGSTANQTITLANNSGAALTIDPGGITLAGANPGDFIETNNCPSLIATGSACAIDVKFAPLATGTRIAELEVADSDPSSPQIDIVQGTGDDFSLGVQPGSQSQITAVLGTTATFNLNVTADQLFSGSVNLNCPTNLPALTTCTLKPTAVTLSAGQTQNFTASFLTTAQETPTTGSLPPDIFPPSKWTGGYHSTALALMALLFASGLGVLAWVRISKLKVCGSKPLRWLTMSALVAVIAFTPGCHHSSTPSNGKTNSTPPAAPPPTTTPTGTYTFLVQGSAQGAGRGVTITLIVAP